MTDLEIRIESMKRYENLIKDLIKQKNFKELYNLTEQKYINNILLFYISSKSKDKYYRYKYYNEETKTLDYNKILKKRYTKNTKSVRKKIDNIFNNILKKYK